MIYLDTETCGFHGMPCLLQYARDEADVCLYDLWLHPVGETVSLLWELTRETVVGFNLVFDAFHICKCYTIFKLLAEAEGDFVYPINHIDKVAELEMIGRDGPCLKPAGVFDLMLHARKGPYQSTMDRKDIRIKRVPVELAQPLCEVLGKMIPMNDIYFSRFSDPTRRWVAYETEDKDDNFRDVVLKFKPSSALKAIVFDAGIRSKDSRFLFEQVEVDHKFRPVEFGFAPFAMAPYTSKTGKTTCPGPSNWYGRWPEVIKQHINHWGYNERAREYAKDDVLDTRALYHYFEDPEPDDNDSVLAWAVAASRWRGFSVDLEEMSKRVKEESDKYKAYSKLFNPNKPDNCRAYLSEVMSPDEQLIIKDTTKKLVLEAVSHWKEAEVCESCGGMGCDDCQGGLVMSDTPHPAATRALEILDARSANNTKGNYLKIIDAGRFHASFNIIGTKSSRMSGADQLNPQGIKRTEEVRRCFTMTWGSEIGQGGDYDGQEVTIADIVYHDPNLRKVITSGKKLHGIFGSKFFFPNLTYEEILKTKNLEGDADKYLRSKNGVFAIYYFGNEYTLHNRVGIPETVAEEAFRKINREFPDFAKSRERIIDQFTAISQPRGLGTKVEYNEPPEYIESVFGFRRYFTLENKVVKCLYDLAENLPQDWNDLQIRVQRRDRVQTACGAVRSALYGAAFGVQGQIIRAAGNHLIQSSGASITKGLQCAIWKLQPVGINPWKVQVFNVHDEVWANTSADVSGKVPEVVNDYNERLRERIPLLKMEWGKGLKSWADKS